MIGRYELRDFQLPDGRVPFAGEFHYFDDNQNNFYKNSTCYQREIIKKVKLSFAEWLGALRDVRAKARIWQRLSRVERGNFGDHKGVGGGVWEMRIDCGVGYRVYYALYENVVVLLFCGGDKTSQQLDVQLAKNYKH